MVCSSAGGSAGGVFGGAARPGRQAGSFLLINRASQHPCESPHPPSHTLTLPAYSLPCLPCLPCPACLPPLPVVQAPHHQVGHAGPAAACARLLPSSHPQPLQARLLLGGCLLCRVHNAAVACQACFCPCRPAHLLAAICIRLANPSCHRATCLQAARRQHSGELPPLGDLVPREGASGCAAAVPCACHHYFP
jgi:hypothetical protein